MSENRRRAARINASFWLRIRELESPAAVLTRGDISLSGLYVETEHVLEAGRSYTLELTSADQTSKLVIAARLIRLSTVETVWTESTVAGAAFEYVRDQSLDTKISEFVSVVLNQQMARAKSLWSANETPPAQGQASQVIEAHPTFIAAWPLRAGQTVCADMRVGETAKPITFVGTVVSIDDETNDGNARMTVTFDLPTNKINAALTSPPPDKPVETFGLSIDDAVETLLSQVDLPDHAGEV